MRTRTTTPLAALLLLGCWALQPAALHATDPLADPGWPGLRGPLGTGVMPAPAGTSFVAKLMDSKTVRVLKPLWISEAQDLPIGWGFGVGPPVDDIAMRGGYGGPVAAEGKVFIYFHGTQYRRRGSRGHGRQQGRRRRQGGQRTVEVEPARRRVSGGHERTRRKGKGERA